MNEHLEAFLYLLGAVVLMGLIVVGTLATNGVLLAVLGLLLVLGLAYRSILHGVRESNDARQARRLMQSREDLANGPFENGKER